MIEHNSQKRPDPIRSKTEQSYLASIQHQFRRATSRRITDPESPPAVSILQVAQDLVDRSDISDATKGPYRAALLWFIRSQTVQDPELDHSRTLLESIMKKPGPQPSTVRARTISKSDLSKLLDEINDRGTTSIWARRTALWLRATLSTGLRPTEWILADWTTDQRTSLTVKTSSVKLLPPAFIRLQQAVAEASNIPILTSQGEIAAAPADPGSSEGAVSDAALYRTVTVPTELDRSIVQSHFDALHDVVRPEEDIATKEAQFDLYYANCSTVLRRATKKIWGGKRAYSLGALRIGTTRAGKS